MTETLIEDGINGESILTCASRVAQTIENSEDYSEIMSLIAIRCSELGLLDTALELSELIDDPYSREQTLANIAAECVDFDENDLAEELLGEIEDPGLHGAAMEQMAAKYAEAEKFEQALEIADRMDDSGQALARVALIYAHTGLFDDALEVARSIEDFGLKATTLVELASRGYRSGSSPEETEQLLAEIEKTAEEIEVAQEKINALFEIASSYKEIGKSEPAFEILSRALKLNDELESAPYAGLAQDYEKDKTLANIASRFALIGRFDMAERVIEKIDDPFQFAAAQADVALEYHKAGRSGQALTLLADAFEVARDQEVYGEHTLALRESLFSALSTSYATVGHSEEALQAAGFIDSANLRFGTLREIAKAFARTGRLDSLAKAAEMIEGVYAKVLYGIGVSDAFVEAEQTELAARSLHQALADAGAIELAYEKALALMEIALRLTQRGEDAKASELLFKALQTTAQIKSGYQKSRVLVALDDMYRKAGQNPGEREESVLQKITP